MLKDSSDQEELAQFLASSFQFLAQFFARKPE